MRTLLGSKPGSEEWKATHEQMEHVRRRKAKRIPSHRHKQRETALYVDPISGGWNRPNAISKTIAREFVQDAAIDYSLVYDRYTNSGFDDPELQSALEQWAERPTLLTPEWPKL